MSFPKGVSPQQMREYEELVTLVANHTAAIADHMADELEGRRDPRAAWTALRDYARSIRNLTAEYFAKAVLH